MQEHAQGRGFQGFSRDLSHPPPQFGAHVHQICMHKLFECDCSLCETSRTRYKYVIVG